MHKRITVAAGALLAMTLMTASPMSEQAYAAGQPDLGIAPYAVYIMEAHATLDISGSNAAISGHVRGTLGITTKAQVTISLQEKIGSTWFTIGGPWTSGEISGTVASTSATRGALSSSGTYRAKAICQAYQGSWENITVYDY